MYEMCVSLLKDFCADPQGKENNMHDSKWVIKIKPWLRLCRRKSLGIQVVNSVHVLHCRLYFVHIFITWLRPLKHVIWNVSACSVWILSNHRTMYIYCQKIQIFTLAKKLVRKTRMRLVFLPVSKVRTEFVFIIRN